MDDDGDYVRLREIPGVGPVAGISKGEHSDDTASEDNKVIKIAPVNGKRKKKCIKGIKSRGKGGIEKATLNF